MKMFNNICISSYDNNSRFIDTWQSYGEGEHMEYIRNKTEYVLM